MHHPDIQVVTSYLMDLQNKICQTFATVDGKAHFIQDHWKRPEGGEGRTHVIADGRIFEKAAVNFSHVWGDKLPAASTAKHPDLQGGSFQAMGLSLISHPHNPYAPTVHFNLRFFFTASKWWFGGGFDLTPYYGFSEDCHHWHQTAKTACDPFGEDLYPQFKKAADDYFYLPHRKEARGIGGIFFDDIHFSGDFAKSQRFIESIGDHFLPAYLPILERRMQLPFGEREQKFQRYRRGRYVEFNLIYDRGTLFGLQFGGRTESILVSLPPTVEWRYDWTPSANSAEEQLYTIFLPPQDWIKEKS